MLIVIVIIGILAAALVPRLQSVQGRARDTDRKIDFKTIADANEIYRLDNGTYAGVGGNVNSQAGSASRIPWLTGILITIPLDPRNTGGWPYNGANTYLYYHIYNTPYQTYTLMGALESTQDVDRCQIKQYRFYNGSTINSLC